MTLNKTYFCSDTHFDHPNILKYEPQRIGETIRHMMDMGEEVEFLEKLDILSRKYGNYNYYVDQYNASVVSQMIEADTFIEEVIKGIYDDNNFYDETYSEEENKNFKELQKEQKQVILDYHNKMLISNWNYKVDVNDTVYFLGDFAFRNKTKAELIGRKLNGHKIIILGNHDDRKHNSDGSVMYNSTLEAHFKACGFERVEFNPIVLKGCFILSHEPLYYTNDSIPYFNIYGHVHSDPRFKTKTSNSFCCCLDRHNYEPVELEEYNTYHKNEEN